MFNLKLLIMFTASRFYGHERFSNETSVFVSLPVGRHLSRQLHEEDLQVKLTASSIITFQLQ